MSGRHRLPTNQTHQCRRCRGDNGYRDKSSSQDVPETIHDEKTDIFSIHPVTTPGRIAITC
jgi:hypothetical protein